jgi:hypothetical protein
MEKYTMFMDSTLLKMSTMKGSEIAKTTLKKNRHGGHKYLALKLIVTVNKTI